MGNHYHLLLETPRGNLSQVLHHINGAYTTYFNVKRGRSGHLFQGRFKGILVEKDAYCKELSRYIHLNPVRVGLVRTPMEYRWSSYRYFIGKASKPGWLTTEWVLEDFGGNGEKGFRGYREYVERQDLEEMENPLKKVIGSTYLGSQDFIKRISGEYLERNIDKRNVPAIKTIRRGPSVRDIAEAVVKVAGRDHVLFRKICVYLSHQHSGLSLDQIGSCFGMKGSAVSQAIRRFKGRIEREKELRDLASRITKEALSNVET
jgi:hypothetical protein